MNPLIHYKTTILSLLSVLGCVALLPKVQGVVPAPDGGYPGGNTAEGQNALFILTSGGFNTAVGFFSLRSNTEGSFNTATGAGTLLFNITGGQNTATGTGALLSNTMGDNNTATGVNALSGNTIGDFNTANGYQALLSNTGGDENTATGAAALQNNSSGSFNTADGRFALFNNFTGNFNIALGNFAGEGITSANNVIAIGTSGQNVSNSCYIGNIWSQPGGSQAVYVNSEGKLGQIVSSRRFKAEIKPMEEASEVIYDLKPVSFRYKPEIEPTGPLCFGLIAEQVEEVNSDLVTRGSDGKVNSVRYDAVNAMLLNEFLKEHRKNEKQEATIAQQRKDFEAIIANLKPTDTKHQKQIDALTAALQKVSAQLELSEPGATNGVERLIKQVHRHARSWPCDLRLDGQRGDAKEFVVQAEERLVGFVELESAIGDAR